jgi:hypothetical protein
MYVAPKRRSVSEPYSLTTQRTVKGKASRVTVREAPYGCEISRLPHCLDNQLTYGDEVARLTHRSPFTPQENCWYSFLFDAESTPWPQCGWKV